MRRQTFYVLWTWWLPKSWWTTKTMTVCFIIFLPLSFIFYYYWLFLLFCARLLIWFKAEIKKLSSLFIMIQFLGFIYLFIYFFFSEIFDDIREECSKFGRIRSLQIPRPSTDHQVLGVGKVWNFLFSYEPSFEYWYFEYLVLGRQYRL